MSSPPAGIRRNRPGLKIFLAALSTLFLLLFLAGGAEAFEELKEPGPGEVEVRFSYQPPVDVDEVYLSGQFNDWDPEGTLMTDDTGDGIYDVVIYLEPGEYEYKFVVDGDNWITPEDAEDYAPDGFGGENAVITVEEDEALPEERAELGDGHISSDMLQHDIEDPGDFNPISRDELTLHFSARRDEVENVQVHLQFDGAENMSREMRRFLSYSTSDYFRDNIDLPLSQFSYYFEVIDDDTTYYYGRRGAVEDREELEKFEVDLQEEEIFYTPDWATDAVFYQIFPDRFARGSSENDPARIELYRSEDERYEAYIPEWDQGIKPGEDPVLRGEDQLSDDDNAIHPPAGYYAFYGGDLLGVEEKIPYLEELGINAVYFNPIFEASAYHRYNTAGFEYIDESLVHRDDQEASLEFFDDLVDSLNERGIKVILDGVFNHVGYEHWAFQDVIENEEESPYIDWFDVHDFPVKSLYEQQQEELAPNYDAWWDYGHMPELNLTNPEVRDYIWEITEKWMDMGIDGWRLDVPEYAASTDPEFWSDWREHVRSLDDEAYLSGEIWDDASDYLQGDEFDAVMNYRFRNAVNSFVGQSRMTALEFHREMMRILLDYPDQAAYSLMNLLGSHDTARYMEVIDGDRERFKLSKLLQFTYFGAPMIYYGDEIGMEGGDDPDNRRPMVWEDRGYTEPDDELREYVSELAEMRDENEVLRRGDIYKIPTENERVYAFQRSSSQEDILVFINSGEDETELEISAEDLTGVEIGDSAYDIIDGREVEIEDKSLIIDLQPVSGAVISLD